MTNSSTMMFPAQFMNSVGAVQQFVESERITATHSPAPGTEQGGGG
jgi:hypothetical protein